MGRKGDEKMLTGWFLNLRICESGVSKSELSNWEIVWMGRYCDVWVSIRVHVGWCVIMMWFMWRESKKWDDGIWLLEFGWLGTWAVKGSNLPAHHGLKNNIFDIFVLYSFIRASKSCFVYWCGENSKKSWRKYTNYACLSLYLCMYCACDINSIQ